MWKFDSLGMCWAMDKQADAGSSTGKGKANSPRRGPVFALGIWAVVVAVSLEVHSRGTLPPHSAHDAFLLVPQLVHLLAGSTPDDIHFGMFNATWFSTSGGDYADFLSGSMGPFVERIFGNVREHTWIDAPHPIALMAALQWVAPMGTLGPVLVQCGYFLVLMASLLHIGTRVHSMRVGLLAVALAASTPGLFGAIHYIEPHLAVAAMSTACVALLMQSDGLRRWSWALAASVCLWSLSRSGEGSGEVVIAGLVVVGPVLGTVMQSDRTLKPIQWVVGLSALIVPFALLADWSWMLAAMERVTRAFADPVVQTDVVEKGGALANRSVWVLAYGILAFTDYFRPLLAGVVLTGVVCAVRSTVKNRLVLVLWCAVPWLALSWMQRKASWYGIALLPPVVMLAAVGLDRICSFKMRWSVAGLAIAQMVMFSMVPVEQVPAAVKWFRDPLPLHDWRLRRIEYLQPSVSPANSTVVRDLDRLLVWMKKRDEFRPVALMTMGTQHDYAARYYLQMNRRGIEAINLSDPRLRESRYHSLHPSDFGTFVFLDGGAKPWPPTDQQADWLATNLHCQPEDGFDSFIAAVTARAAVRVDGFYPLEDIRNVPHDRSDWSGDEQSSGDQADMGAMRGLCGS